GHNDLEGTSLGMLAGTAPGGKLIGIENKCPDRAEKASREPLSLGQALAAHVRLIVWCRSCNHRAEPDIATQVAQHGAGMPVPDWARLLRCTECGERDADFVVIGTRRRHR